MSTMVAPFRRPENQPMGMVGQRGVIDNGFSVGELHSPVAETICGAVIGPEGVMP